MDSWWDSWWAADGWGAPSEDQWRADTAIREPSAEPRRRWPLVPPGKNSAKSTTCMAQANSPKSSVSSKHSVLGPCKPPLRALDGCIVNDN